MSSRSVRVDLSDKPIINWEHAAGGEQWVIRYKHISHFIECVHNAPSGKFKVLFPYRVIFGEAI